MSKQRKAKKTKPRITSFIVRTITAKDRATLDKMKQAMGESTDSQCMVRLLAQSADRRDKYLEIVKRYNALGANFMEISELLLDMQTADQQRQTITKGLARLRNEVCAYYPSTEP